MIRTPLTRTPLSLLASDALALHEGSLQELLSALHRPQDAGPSHKSHASQPAAASEQASVEDYLPTVNELIAVDGVAVLPLHGLMVKRSQVWHGWYQSHVIVGSDHWASVLRELTARTDIHTIVIDSDTGGGQVAGTETLADALHQARTAGKSVIAVVNEFCASAGLWVCSQATRVVIPSSGTIGSLGVYSLHFDDTRFLSEKWGVDKSVIHRGKYKAVDERPLDPDARADLQRFIDSKYSLFVDAVARGRGLTPDQVTERWGDSRLLTGTEAVSTGLADEIGTLQDVLDSLRAGRGGRVSIDVPPADTEGEPGAMKLNASGQILDDAGKVVGTLAELQLDAAALTKHFAAQTSELIDSAVATAKAAAAESEKAAVAAAITSANTRLQELHAGVGAEKAIAAFLSGDSLEKAKASMADDLAAALKATEAELASLKAAPPAAGRAPAFAATDAGQSGIGKPADNAGDSKDAPFAADWQANKDSCQDKYPSLEAYGAHRRYLERRSA